MNPRAPRKTRNGIDLSKLPSHLLRRCAQYANDLFSREPALRDLTKQQFTVLVAVEHNEGTSQTSLVAITGIDRSTLAEMIRRMIEKKLLNRKRTETDKRTQAVYLAADGRKALRNGRAASDRVERTLLSGLSAIERLRLLKMLAIIASRAEASEPRTRVDFQPSTLSRVDRSLGQSPVIQAA